MQQTIGKLLVLTTLLCSVLGLAGCVTSIKKMDLSSPESLNANPASISIDKLLANARDQRSEHLPERKELHFKFKPGQFQLNASDKQQLLSFADGKKSPLILACAPGSSHDPIAAAAVAIKRCLKISRLLEEREFNNKVRLSPHLMADQVRVYR